MKLVLRLTTCVVSSRFFPGLSSLRFRFLQRGIGSLARGVWLGLSCFYFSIENNTEKLKSYFLFFIVSGNWGVKRGETVMLSQLHSLWWRLPKHSWNVSISITISLHTALVQWHSQNILTRRTENEAKGYAHRVQWWKFVQFCCKYNAFTQVQCVMSLSDLPCSTTTDIVHITAADTGRCPDMH